MKSYFDSLPMIKFPSFPLPSYIFLILVFKNTISCSVFRKQEPLLRWKISKTSIFLSHSLLHTLDLQAACLVTTSSCVSTHLGSWSGFGWEQEFFGIPHSDLWAVETAVSAARAPSLGLPGPCPACETLCCFSWMPEKANQSNSCAVSKGALCCLQVQRVRCCCPKARDTRLCSPGGTRCFCHVGTEVLQRNQLESSDGPKIRDLTVYL